MLQGTPATETRVPGLDPLSIVQHSSGIVLVVLVILLVFSLAVWVIWLLKALQLGRLRRAQHGFERVTETIERPDDLVATALSHRSAPGARVVLELAKRNDAGAPGAPLLLAVAKRAIATEQQKASSLMPSLSSIASSAPFIGLFGTVVGIINAFELIGVAKSASLPVVAPAIGEALFTTAVGLFAAIPATIGYNFVDKRIGDLIEEISASAEAWVEIMAGRATAGARTRPFGVGSAPGTGE